MQFSVRFHLGKASWVALSYFLLVGCGDAGFKYSIEAKLNPYGKAPLTALLDITAEKPVNASVKVLGRTPVEHTTETPSENLSVPVLGLYANRVNDLEVTLNYEGGTVTETIQLETGPLPDVFPQIEINKLNRAQMAPGLHACDVHFANHGKFRSIPLIFDDQGEVRWYLDLTSFGTMISPFQRLRDGALLMVNRHQIFEFDMLGKELRISQINTNYGMHHDVVEVSGDKLLVCVGKRNQFINIDGKRAKSDSDFVILIDRKTSRILREWDLAKHLDVSRNDMNFFRPGDWLHMNGLAFDESDGSIIVSGKNQGLVKISWKDELQWIMAPHRNWGKAGRDGNGFDTKPFLLTAVAEDGKAFSNSVQQGESSDDLFDFPWAPHSPRLLPNGNLMVFDNGVYRNFKNENPYSRAVEYKVDETAKTVQQVWQYGKERKQAFYSSIVSDVDYMPESNHVLVTSGYLNPRKRHSGKIVEVDYSTGEVVFEATLYLKTLNGSKQVGGWGQTDILYRTERLELKY